MVETGCDRLIDKGFSRFKGRRVGLVSNQASISRNLDFLADSMISAGIELCCIFGPQHGIFAETQANMVEWEGYRHPWLGIPVYSLYGKERTVKDEWLSGIDAIVIDLQDVGARPYTYLWTSVIVMKACAERGIELHALDRPNPIGGIDVEGPILREEFKSFVGLFPMTMRHGLTIGEALKMIDETERIGSNIDVLKMRGWERSMYFAETGLPWVPPSPNIPTPESALVYPGTVLLEGTNISEGRGTTRPFEIVGAPWIEPQRLLEELDSRGLEGVHFRPLHFIPTWDKYSGKLCGGVQIHVTDAAKFKPVRCGAEIIAAAARLYPDEFRWKEPPYEYEWKISPIDILIGNSELRNAIDSGTNMQTLFDDWQKDEESFKVQRERFLLY